MTNGTQHRNSLRGVYQDQVIRGDGSTQSYVQRGNIVVDQCRRLLAAFMSGDTAVEAGVRFIALGRGEAGWDTLVPAPPPASTGSLSDTTPVHFQVAGGALQIGYLDPQSNPVAGPTVLIEATLTLPSGSLPAAPGETSYPLREFALFGRYDGSDFIINYARHPVIHIGAGDSLIRRIRLAF